MDAPTLVIRSATMSDGSLFPLMNMWDVETPDGRVLSDLTTPQVQSLAAREGWQIQPAQ